MRRRQSYAEKPPEAPPVNVIPAPPNLERGMCPKCRKIIGRGLHFHVKACNGNLH